ncbi:MAG: hypothetical protein LUH10_15300 [Tannerellaceae bacterium]|nr:hypothetical protein [Tannerellaceae bacterium]
MIKCLFCLIVFIFLIGCNPNKHIPNIKEEEIKEQNENDSCWRHIIIIINDNRYEIFT